MMSCPSCHAAEAAAGPRCGHQFKSSWRIHLWDYLIGAIVAGVLLRGTIFYAVLVYSATCE